MDRGAWWVTVQRVGHNWVTEHTQTRTHRHIPHLLLKPTNETCPYYFGSSEDGYRKGHLLIHCMGMLPIISKDWGKRGKQRSKHWLSNCCVMSLPLNMISLTHPPSLWGLITTLTLQRKKLRLNKLSAHVIWLKKWNQSQAQVFLALSSRSFL